MASPRLAQYPAPSSNPSPLKQADLGAQFIKFEFERIAPTISQRLRQIVREPANLKDHNSFAACFQEGLGMLPTAKTAFTTTLGDLENKDITPLIMEPGDIEVEKIKTRVLTMAFKNFVPTEKDFYSKEIAQVELHQALLFYIASETQATKTAIRSVVPTNLYPPSSKEFSKVREGLIELATKAEEASIEYLVKALESINKALRSDYGSSFLLRLSRDQRRKLFGQVYEQFPIFTLKSWRSLESRSVYFADIYSRKWCADRVKYRRYFKTQFLDMLEITYLFRILLPSNVLLGNGPTGNDVVFALWKSFPSHPKLKKLSDFEPYYLPGIPDGFIPETNSEKTVDVTMVMDRMGKISGSGVNWDYYGDFSSSDSEDEMGCDGLEEAGY
ncbi:hypothetical protein G7Y89_g6137 [Cudoniella acicularis]|uniref:Uncharacterized protein n=1 Tax=Cudoniella acicularis TaxID=354080 RepID=A0A8H4RMI4_9HELO|nr:hypothetical protein G7Y89_g6137 [Cudoniella acicularis]